MSQFINYYLGVVQIVGGIEVKSMPFRATPTIYNVALAIIDTEYSQALPAACKCVSVSLQDGTAAQNFRVAYVTGKVAAPTAPYIKLNGDREYWEDGLELTGVTIYVAASAVKTAQIIAWT